MDKYMFLNSQTGQVLYQRQYSGKEDLMTLGMQLTALIQLSQQSLRSLESKELILFSYSPTTPVVLVAYFPLHTITLDDATALCSELIRTFTSLFQDYSGGKQRYRVFKQFDEAFEKVVEQQFHTEFKAFLREVNKEVVDFAYLTVLGEAPQDRELKHAESSIVQVGTPLTTDVSALTRGSTPVPYSGKKKYPIKPEQAHLAGSSNEFARLLAVKKTPDDRILGTLESLGKLCGELMETCHDSWSHLRVMVESRAIIGLRSGQVTVFLVLSEDVPLSDQAWVALERLRIWAIALKHACDKK